MRSDECSNGAGAWEGGRGLVVVSGQERFGERLVPDSIRIESHLVVGTRIRQGESPGSEMYLSIGIEQVQPLPGLRLVVNGAQVDFQYVCQWSWVADSV